jgi:adenosine/AMP kinase
VRWTGNDHDLIELARKNALKIAAGHSFIIFLRDAYPINVLNAIKMVPEVCRIFCATANPVTIILAENEQGRGILGVIDGFKTKGVEGEEEIRERKELLRRFGYKL